MAPLRGSRSARPVSQITSATSRFLPGAIEAARVRFYSATGSTLTLPMTTALPAPAPARLDTAPARFPALAATAAASLLAACGGGGAATEEPPPPVTETPPTDAEASRFLTQASMGASRTEIARVVALGYTGWLDEQFAKPRSLSRWDWLMRRGYDASRFRVTQDGFDNAAWRALLTGTDTLRQRVTLALSEILVVSIDGLSSGGGWKAFQAAAYLDLLEEHAFGNLRDMLGAVSRSTAMAVYLTYRGNVKADPATGSLPDENYARELMQLFTIGLLELQADGSPRLISGQPVETYGPADVSGLARVFTGWVPDKAGDTGNTPAFQRRPLVQVAARHETGAKHYHGTTIHANTNGTESLRQAQDVLFAHPNVGPFWSQQLIKRLVTSNPSAAYVGRVAAVFDDDGSGVRGNLRAVVRAIVLDTEARSASRLTNPRWGKLREPILRVAAWGRAFAVDSPGGAWAMGNTSDPSEGLGQGPLRSPSVFNFFRPGYVPPNTAIAEADLVAPEFQITSESSVIGFLNFFQRLLEGGVGDLTADYTSLMPLADDAASLADELNLVLAANRLGSDTLATIVAAIDSMPKGTAASRLNRIKATLMLVMAAPENLVQK